MHRKCFRIIFQNPEFVKNLCKDFYNPIHFPGRNCLDNQ